MALALLNHIYGVKKTGKAIKASDHIRYAPLLGGLYDKAEKRFFDPYNIGLNIVNIFSRIALWIDRAIDWVYNTLVVSVTYAVTNAFRKLHTGNYRTYILWSVGVAAAIIIFLIRSI